MPVVQVENAKVQYTVQGEGPRLVLVHGTGSGGANAVWGYQTDEFATRNTVILPELSGSIHTVDDGEALTVEGLAQQVIAVIEDSGKGPVDLIGFSLGGTIVAAVAGLRPDLVRKLVSIVGFAHSDHPALKITMNLWLGFSHDAESFGRFATITAFSSEFLGKIGVEAVEENTHFMQPDEGTLRHIELNRNVDIRYLLPKITAETLIIGAAKDSTVPADNPREIHSVIKGSRYEEFNTGHIVHAEQPERFMQLVTGFLHEQ